VTDPAVGPFLFDTSAEYWLERSTDPDIGRWVDSYARYHSKQVSAITVMERMRGYAMSIQRDPPDRRALLALKRQEYLDSLGEVRPVDAPVALQAAELAAMLPQPPTPPKRAHRFLESRQDRLFRWRCDILIAATALVAGMPLVHHNPRDFETIRMAIETSPQRFPTLGPLNLLSVVRLTGA
jgi:predicted nucleic acid-binding protein